MAKTGGVALALLASTNQSTAQVGTPVGEEFLVNTETLRDQILPSVASDDEGNYIVVWKDNTGEGQAISGQRYSALGLKQGEEFLIAERLGTSSIVGEAEVAMDSDGDFVVVWTRNLSLDGDGLGVFARSFRSDGSPRASEFQVNVYTTGSQRNPDVTMDADGNFVVVWEGPSSNGPSLEVLARRFSVGGVPRSDEFQVNLERRGTQTTPAVDASEGGSFVVAWRCADGATCPSLGIFVKRYDAEGRAIGREFRASNEEDGNGTDPDVAVDARGAFVVVWSTSVKNGIYGRRFDENGEDAGREFRVNTPTSGRHFNPSVSMDADGDFVVVWETASQIESDGNRSGVFAREFDKDDQDDTVDFLVNTYTTGEQITPSVAMDRDGDYVVAWTSEDQLGSRYLEDVFAQRYEALQPALDLRGTTPYNAGFVDDDRVETWIDLSGNDSNGRTTKARRAAHFRYRDSGAGSQPALYFDGDEFYAIPPSDALIDLGPYRGKTTLIEFSADDTAERQVLFEQGSDERGQIAYVQADSVYVGAWNLRGRVWGPIWHKRQIVDGGLYRLTLVLDAEAGTFEAYLNGNRFGTATGADILQRARGGGSGVGRAVGTTRYEDLGASREAGLFQGYIATILQYNNAVTERGREILEDTIREFFTIPDRAQDFPTDYAASASSEVATPSVYPNPFAESATLRYHLGEPTEVNITVYDVMGRRVATLASGRQAAGWQTVTLDGSRWASGVYVVRAQVGEAVWSRRVLHTKR